MQFKLLAAFVLLSSSFSSVLAETQAPYFSGFNFGSTKPNGECKTTEDWKTDFATVQKWSPGEKAKFNYAKIFSTGDCDALDRAVPAALATGMKIWAGVWAVDEGKFNREKGALENAIKKYGQANKWLGGVNVGSESLYRKEIEPWRLATYIYDVKGMIQQAYKVNVPVGCADTWTSWVDPANKDVVKAVDVVLMNGFPYWQGITKENALKAFRDAIWNTRKAIGDTKQIIIGETGWPTAGGNFQSAPADLASLQKYYADASCWLQNSGKYPWFWFSAFDQPERGANGVEGNFGLANKDRVPKVKTFKCPA